MANAIKWTLRVVGVIIVAILTFVTLLSCGREKNADKREYERFRSLGSQSMGMISIFYDTETGVEYARFGSSTPFVLVNSDGTPRIYRELDISSQEG